MKIELKKMRYVYPTGEEALKGIDLTIEGTDPVAIIGQNGAGKTTIVKHFNGILRPASGDVFINGENIQNRSTAQWSREVGYVFQNPDDQIFHNTVEKEIRFGPEVLKMSESKIKEMVEYSARLTGLTDVMEENPYNLPLSVRKFVTIASILAMDTDIVILDEPTAGQDIRGIRLLENILKELTAKGKTIVTITHDMEFVVNNFNKVFVMAHKNLLKITNPKEVFSDDRLLEESMLMKPYVSEIVSELGFPGQITSRAELVEYVKKAK